MICFIEEWPIILQFEAFTIVGSPLSATFADSDGGSPNLWVGKDLPVVFSDFGTEAINVGGPTFEAATMLIDTHRPRVGLRGESALSSDLARGPCIASDWASLSTCIGGLSTNPTVELTRLIDVPVGGASVIVSTSGATLYSTTRGGLRRKAADLAHGSTLEVLNCERVSLMGLTFIDQVATPGKFAFCGNTTGGPQLSLAGSKYSTITGCSFYNASLFNVAMANANFTIFRNNLLSGCCMFGIWGPLNPPVQTHMYLFNNMISDVNSNALLFSIVDSLIQGNTIARTHTATLFGHDSGGQAALNNGSQRVIISGNLIVNGSVSTGDTGQKTHGFEFSNGPSGVNDVLVHGNAMYNNTVRTHAILVTA